MFKRFILRKKVYSQLNYWKTLCVNIEEDLLLSEVKKIKRNSKGLSSNELILRAQAFMVEHHIKMSRSHLFDLLSVHHLLKRRLRLWRKNPKALHWIRKYPNLFKAPVVAKDQVWISDIIPWKTGHTYVYISFIADAFTKEILGFQISDQIQYIRPIEALENALKASGNRNFSLENLIHHSLHGHQYCAYHYVKLLKEEGVQISMSEPDNFDNILFTEQIGEWIKSKYLDQYIVKSMKEAELVLDYSIKTYNENVIQKLKRQAEQKETAFQMNKKQGLLSLFTLNWKLGF